MTFICKAPWTSVAFQPTGVAPCCVFDLNQVETFKDTQNIFQKVREDFTNGKIPTGCSKCLQTFEINKSGYFQAFDQYETNFKDIKIQEINLRSNNFCNLACRSCGPHFSSKWEEEFQGQIVITKDNDVINKLAQIDLTSLKTIVFAGGEPTIVPEHWYLLNKLLELNHTTPHIRVATNLHNLKYKSYELINLWKNFPNLYLHVSIDAVDKHASNIRSGSNWDTLSKNLLELKKYNISHYVCITVSALNIWFIEETLDRLHKNFSVNINFNLVISPDILNLQVIPDEFRQDLNIMLDRCLDKGYNVHEIKNYLNAGNQSHLWQSFLTYNMLLDLKRNENFCQSLPIFDKIVRQWAYL